MMKYIDPSIGLLLGQNLENIAEIFPKSLSRVVLIRLDRCARESGMPPIFALQNNLDEARRGLSCYLEIPEFQKVFIRNFSDELPDLLREANGETMEAADTHDDFLSALSGLKTLN